MITTIQRITARLKPLKIKEGSNNNHQTITVVTHDFKIGDQVRSSEINKNKIYISNDNHQLKNFYKPYELMKLTDVVGEYDQPETEHEAVHVELKKEKKINKVLKQVGIDQANDLGDSLRIKNPSYKVLYNNS